MYFVLIGTCIDENSECNKACNQCVCKKGFEAKEFNADSLTSYLYEKRQLTTSMCFVTGGKPCLPDLLKNMVNDTENILTTPGNFDKLVTLYAKAVEVYDNRGVGKTEEESKTLRLLEWRLGDWRKLLGQAISPTIGKDSAHWSCSSGSCSSNICDPEIFHGNDNSPDVLKNHLLKSIYLGEKKKNSDESNSSEKVAQIPLISYLLTMMSGLVLSSVPLREIA